MGASWYVALSEMEISEKVAWVLLISIAIECFIEGIGFGLTLQEEPGTALSLFVALLVGLIFSSSCTSMRYCLYHIDYMI